MLGFQIERIKASKLISKIIVATTDEESDDPIVDLCEDFGVECFRGDLNDVLDRYYHAAKKYNAKYVMRLTGDCPFMDPKLIDDFLLTFQNGEFDYLCNTVKPTFPDGLDMWVFSFEALENAWKNAFKPSEREHVVTFIKSHPEIFKIGSFENTQDLSSLRWTVDEAEDLEFVRAVFSRMNGNRYFSMSDILEILTKEPELKKINQTFKRDEGLQKSLNEDEKRYQDKTRENIALSLDKQAESKLFILGQNHLLSKRPDMFSEGVWPGYYKKAKGVEVWDLDGNRYIDMSIGGIGATVLGYADSDINRAVSRAILEGVASSLNCPEEIDLAKLLLKHHPWADMARFARTGGEAMAVAVRIARAYSNKEKIAFCGYHGWQDWYLSASLSGDDALKGHLLPGLPPQGVSKSLFGTALPFHYNNISELKEIVTKHGTELGAIVMEPIRNDRPSAGFLEEVRKIANELNIPLVFDEISSGYRIHTGGAHLLLGVTPDICVFSKAIGNGHAISAVIGKKDVMIKAEKSFISSTCWTERVGVVAALATIQKFEKHNVSAHLIKMGEMVQSVWKTQAFAANLEIEVGGIAPLSHFGFVHPKATFAKAYFVQKMLDRGFLASTIFYSMFAHKEWHIRAYEEAVEITFNEIKQLLENNKIAEALRGKPSNTGFKRLI